MISWNDEDVARAWERFRRRRALAGARVRRLPWWRLRPVGWTAVAGLLLVGVLGFSPAARSATLRVLSLFRISRIATLPMDEMGRAPLANRSTAEALRDLAASTVRVTEMKRPEDVASATAAAAGAGFAVRYAAADAGGAAPRFRLQGGMAVQIRVDRERTQDILDEAGVQGFAIPPDVDGAKIAVTIPRGVAVLYGNCANWARQAGMPGPPENADCTVLMESPGPQVSLPPGLDMQKIAEAGLQLMGWTRAQAEEYCRTVDWASTLVVPFPRSKMQSKTVAVDGAKGVLITPRGAGASSKRARRYVILWSRQGMLYSVSGSGDGAQGLALAARLKP